MMRLLGISADGSVAGYEGARSAEFAEILRHTVDFYSRTGFKIPWISYLAVVESRAVGICSFKSAPLNGRVEIAYFTFPEHEGRGVATEMATRLLAIAKARPEVLCVAAQTLLERSASHRILEKVGFRPIGTVDHPEDGAVLEWQSQVVDSK